MVVGERKSRPGVRGEDSQRYWKQETLGACLLLQISPPLNSSEGSPWVNRTSSTLPAALGQ